MVGLSPLATETLALNLKLDGRGGFLGFTRQEGRKMGLSVEQADVMAAELDEMNSNYQLCLRVNNDRLNEGGSIVSSI